jgi:hypothetical protein
MPPALPACKVGCDSNPAEDPSSYSITGFGKILKQIGCWNPETISIHEIILGIKQLISNLNLRKAQFSTFDRPMSGLPPEIRESRKFAAEFAMLDECQGDWVETEVGVSNELEGRR